MISSFGGVIAAAGVTAPAFGQTAIGTVAFWFGLLCLLVLVGYRYLKYPAAQAAPAVQR